MSRVPVELGGFYCMHYRIIAVLFIRMHIFVALNELGAKYDTSGGGILVSFCRDLLW